MSERRGALIATLTCALGLTMAAFAAAQSSGAVSADVPAAVLKTFQQAYPSATITTASRQRDGNRTVFRVDSVNKGRRQIVVYDANSAALEVAEEVDEKDLPQPVAAGMRSHPRAIFVAGLKVTRGKTVLYQLTLRGTRKTAMVVQPDGTVISFQ